MNQKHNIIGAACTTLLITAMPISAQTSEVMEDSMMMDASPETTEMDSSEAIEDVQPLDEDVSTEASDLKIRPRFAVKRTTDVNGAEGLNYIGGFLPISQKGASEDFSMFFFDGGVSVDDDGEFGGNLLFGYRTLNEANRIFGSYLGLDVRGTEEENSFSQFTFGAESLGKNFDARANVFLSLSDREAITAETANNFRFTGNRLLFDTSQGFQAPASGLDFEVGTKLTDWRRGDLRAYAGLYYYDIDGGEDSVGWRTRLVVRPIPSVNVGLTLQDDDIFGTQLSFSVGALFPSSNSSSALLASAYEEGYNPMVDRLSGRFVKNSTVIIDNYTDQTGDGLIATNPETGNNWYFSFADISGNSNGTFESPFPTFQQALDDAGGFPNDGIAYVLNGGTFDAAAGLTIPEGVIFMSDGVAQVLPVGNLPVANGTSIILPGSGTGNLPTIENSDLIVFNPDTTIDGFDLNGGLFVKDVGGDITIVDNVVDDTVFIDIHDLNDGETITIVDNTIESDEDGIYVHVYNASVEEIVISGNEVEAGDDGVEIYVEDNAFAGEIVISSNAVESGDEGLEINVGDFSSTGDITVSGNILEADENGIQVQVTNYSYAENITVNDNIITADYDGVDLVIAGSSAGNDITVSGNTIDSDQDGIYIGLFYGSVSDNILIDNNTVDADYAGVDVLVFGGSDTGDITISDNTIEAEDEEGIFVGVFAFYGPAPASTGDITISGNTLESQEDDGIELRVANGSSIGDVTISENIIDSNYDAVYVAVRGNNSSGDITVSGNTIESDGDGISLKVIYGSYYTGNITGDITVTGNTIEANYDGIYVAVRGSSGSGNITVSDNAVEADYDGIELRVAYSSYAGDITVGSNTIEANYDGIYVVVRGGSGSGDIAISGNTIEADYDGINVGVFNSSDSGDISVSGNTIEADYDGIDIGVFYGGESGDISVSGNVITSDEDAIQVEVFSTTYGSGDISIDSNTITSGEYAIQVDVFYGAPTGSITVDSNTINDAGEKGVDINIRAGGSTNGVVSVTGNQVMSDENGIELYNYSSGTGICAVLSGNTVADPGGGDFQYLLDGNTPIYLDGAVPTGNVSIGGNVIANTGCAS